MDQFLSRIKARQFAVLIFIINAITAFTSLNFGMLEKVLTSDPKGYYQFLPGLFISGDMQKLPWAIVLDNGNHLSLFHIGVAVLQLPFFLLAHALALIFGLDATGYSDVYAWCMTLSTIVYTSIALYFLFKVLEKRFSHRVTLLTLTLLFLGTNIYYYCTHEPGMSHMYSFFLFAGIVYFTEKYYDKPSLKWAAWIGLFSGIILIIKPNNLIVTLYFIFYNVRNLDDFIQRVQFFLKKFHHVLLMLGLIVLMTVPQMLYWHLVSGQYLLFSYGKGGYEFYWTEPRMWQVLLHPKNGWFLYSPILIFAMYGLIKGIFTLQKNYMITFLIWFVSWYIFASWWCWWFGGAFGHRAFIEYLPLLVIPMAYFFNGARSWKIYYKYILGSFCVLFLFVSVRMTFIYAWPWDSEGWNFDSYLGILARVFFLK